MFKGGNTYTPKIAKIFHFAGLLVPIILVAYALLIQYDVVKIPHPSDIIIAYIVSLWWIILSVLDFFTPHKSKLDSILRLTSYHLLLGMYIILVSGVISPFIIGWFVLMIMSFVSFSRLGLLVSSLSFIIVIVINSITWCDPNSTICGLIMFVAFLMVNITMLYLDKSKNISKNELDRSKSLESLQRDRVLTIINNLSDGILSTDTKGIIKIYNAASLNLIDTNDSLKGRHIDEILPLTDQDKKSISIFKEFQNAKTTVKRDDLDFSFDDGEKIRLELTFSPIHSSYSRSKKSSAHDGYVIIMRDVTKSKSLEEERDEFISVISHELRTPITIAEGTISNVQMMMEHPDVSQEMLSGSIKVAHDQVLFLANMVNDLSALSRAERGVGDVAEIIDVQELAHRLMDKYTPEAGVRGLMLNLDLSPKLGNVLTSRLYLEELLQNFITNAIKYTKVGSVNIKFTQKDDMITFAVKDSGIGICKTDQEKVFNKFYRSEDYRTRETGGTGLGLYVAAKLAHKIGTKIQLTSRLNFGSTFSFSLPSAKDEVK